jgi:MICOS complex subunit MIC27
MRMRKNKRNVNTLEAGFQSRKLMPIFFLVVRDYLNEPDNTIPRAGAIAVGGLAGLIFGVRGGFFRKLIYTSIGAGGVASVCYPKEAEVYAQKSLVESKKFATIGYNFVYGSEYR